MGTKKIITAAFIFTLVAACGWWVLDYRSDRQRTKIGIQAVSIGLEGMNLQMASTSGETHDTTKVERLLAEVAATGGPAASSAIDAMNVLQARPSNGSAVEKREWARKASAKITTTADILKAASK